MSMEATQKVCPNGHRMEPAWEVCPYCPSTRVEDPALARTMKVDATRVASAPAAASSSQPGTADAGRRTEILRREPQAGGIAWFVAATGPGRGQSHRVDRERVIVGAGGACDVTIETDHVSDRHASVRFQEGTFVITDLDSTNGTYVNGDRVQQKPLQDGDRVAFGESEWVFKCVVFDEA